MENLLYGLFSLKGRNLYKINSPVNGRVVDQSEIPDEILSSGVLGQGFGVIPSDGHFVSPFNGSIMDVSSYGHIISLKSDYGIEILIHIGEGTSVLKGNGFSVKVQRGDKVSRGTTLVNVDLDALKSEGCHTLSSVILINSDDYSQFTVFEGECRAGQSEIMLFTDNKVIV